MYKGTTNLDYSTQADGAVGLGDPDLFQSYVVCSEHYRESGINQILRTRITFGKIAAGNTSVEHSQNLFLDATLNEDTCLNSYLIYEDDDPIQPAFFSFGSGEFKVQVTNQHFHLHKHFLCHMIAIS